MQRTEIAKLGKPALVEQITEHLHARGPLAGIAADTLASFIAHAGLVELQAGEALVREGEPATPEVYLLLEGALIVQSGGTRLAKLERPGDVVGEAAVVLGSKRNADVLADSAVRALAIPGKLLARPEFKDVAAGIRGAMLRDDWVQY